jgi:hypothetical protein
MALTNHRASPSATPLPSRGTYPIKANVQIFKGAKVGLDSSGRAMPADTLANGTVQIVGRSSGHYDNRTGSTLGGAAGACDVEVEFGVFGWENSATAAIASTTVPGSVVYAEDDETTSLTSQTATLIAEGIFTELRDGKVYVWMGPHVATLAESSVLADAGMTVSKRTVTVGHADLTDADTSQDINIGAALPANARIVGVDLHTFTAFSGGTVSALAVDIGSSGDVDALVDGADLFTAAVDGGPSTRPAGIRPNKLYATATQLTARFVSTTDNLVNLTAGAITIDVLYVVLA